MAFHGLKCNFRAHHPRRSELEPVITHADLEANLSQGVKHLGHVKCQALKNPTKSRVFNKISIVVKIDIS